jgi:hypothetical protein
LYGGGEFFSPLWFAAASNCWTTATSMDCVLRILRAAAAICAWPMRAAIKADAMAAGSMTG